MLEILANGPPQKKKNPGINQCGEKGSGGGITYLSVLCI
jgi:hypothetical protein